MAIGQVAATIYSEGLRLKVPCCHLLPEVLTLLRPLGTQNGRSDPENIGGSLWLCLIIFPLPKVIQMGRGRYETLCDRHCAFTAFIFAPCRWDRPSASAKGRKLISQPSLTALRSRRRGRAAI